MDLRVFDVLRFPRLFLPSANRISVIKELLTTGYYCVVFVDEYYLPNRVASHQFHFIHEFLVYGIEPGRVLAVGMNINNQLSNVEFPEREFSQALDYVDCHLADRSDCRWIENKIIMGIRTQNRNKEYPLHKDIVFNKLEAFFEGKAYQQDVSLRITGQEIIEKSKESRISQVQFGKNVWIPVYSHLRKIEDTLCSSDDSDCSYVFGEYERIHAFRDQCYLAMERAKSVEYEKEFPERFYLLVKMWKLAEELRFVYLKSQMEKGKLHTKITQLRSVMKRMEAIEE